MAQKLRVGIISANWGARAHLPAWRSLPDVEVVAICTSRRETAEAAAVAHNIPRAYWDYREMARDPDIDLIDCGTRPDLRADMVLAAFEGGKHVYNGVPFAVDVKAARRLAAAQKASGKWGAVDAFAIFAPAHLRMRDLLARGAIGRPQHMRMDFNLPLFSPARPGFAFNWFHEAGRGVSALRNLGSHTIHCATQILGEPIVAVTGFDGQHQPVWNMTDGTNLRAHTNDTAMLLMRSASGVMIQMNLSWVAWAGDGWTTDIQGEGGRLLAHHAGFPRGNMSLRGAIDGAFTLSELDIPEDLLAPEGLAINAHNEASEHTGIPATVPVFTIATGLKDFVEAIRANRPPMNGFTEALAVEETLAAVDRAVASGRWEAVA